MCYFHGTERMKEIAVTALNNYILHYLQLRKNNIVICYLSHYVSLSVTEKLSRLATLVLKERALQ